MIVDTPPITTVMSHYDETGQPVACGAGRIPAGARTIATHPALGIPCGALVILTLPDGRLLIVQWDDGHESIRNPAVLAPEPHK